MDAAARTVVSLFAFLFSFWLAPHCWLKRSLVRFAFNGGGSSPGVFIIRVLVRFVAFILFLKRPQRRFTFAECGSSQGDCTFVAFVVFVAFNVF